MAEKVVLLIDDEPYIREVVQACLRDLCGWTVTAVASAQEALKQLSVEQPDVILLDVLMPGMDGITFIHRLNKKPLKQPIPIILLSAKARWFTPQQLHQLGIAEAISKPFNPVTLSQDMARILGWN
jgi:CheY-like chemotaxis protein